jgi:hypothetical protein
MALTPALPSISLYGGEHLQVQIKDAIRSVVTTEGIKFERLFDSLAAFKAEDSSWVVSDMLVKGQARYDRKTDLFHLV